MLLTFGREVEGRKVRGDISLLVVVMVLRQWSNKCTIVVIRDRYRIHSQSITYIVIVVV